MNYRGPVSELDTHEAKVEATFREQPPRSAKEARKRIKNLTGIKSSLSRVRAFMKRIVVQLLERIAEDYTEMSINIILDNARFQHCQFVKEAALRLNITLIFLLPYSPNLNLIERLWKFVKAEVCAARYFKDAKTFQAAIIDFLNQLDRKPMKKQLKSRLKLHFQLFSHSTKSRGLRYNID